MESSQFCIHDRVVVLLPATDLPVARMRVPPLSRTPVPGVGTVALIKICAHFLEAPLATSILRVPVCAFVLPIKANPFRGSNIGVAAPLIGVEIVFFAAIGLPFSEILVRSQFQI